MGFDMNRIPASAWEIVIACKDDNLAEKDNEISRLQAEIDRLKASQMWLCGSCNSMIQPEDLRPGFECGICPKCGEANVRPAWMHRIDKLQAENAKLRVALISERARGNMYLEEVLDWDDYEYKAWVLPEDDRHNQYAKHCDDRYMHEYRAKAEQELRAEGLIK